MDSDQAAVREMEIIGFAQVSPQVAQVGLREKGGTRLCALHCDPWSALGIIQAFRREPAAQPHQQDLLKTAFAEGGISVTGVLLMSGTEQYLWARLTLAQGDRIFTMDCRAACGIGQAVRWNVPILMDEHALRTAHRHATSSSAPHGSAPPAGRPS